MSIERAKPMTQGAELLSSSFFFFGVQVLGSNIPSLLLFYFFRRIIFC